MKFNLKKSFFNFKLELTAIFTISRLVRSQSSNKPMLLSTKAYELLISSQNATECRDPCFVDPATIAFTSMVGGEYYKDEKRFIIVLSKTATCPAVLLNGFYRTDLSNFSKTDEVEIHCTNPSLTPKQVEIIDKINNAKYGCGEKRFKLACAAFHLKPDDDLNENNLKVVSAILNAAEPVDAKTATFKLENFNKDWDLVARKAMDWAQMNRLRDPLTHKYFLTLAQIAKDHDIKPEDCFFFEATQDTPATDAVPATADSPAKKARKAQKADLIWGTGIGIDDLLNSIVMEGNTEVLHKTVSGYKKLFDEEYTPLYKGKNGLGLSIKGAFERLCGVHYECLFEEQWETINRIQAFDGFDFLKYEPADAAEPAAKRSCSRESPEPGEISERSCSEVVGISRTSSCQ